MFGWLQYKQRLQNVRKDLAELEEEMETLPIVELRPDVTAIAKGLGRVAGILVRVIDSLPG